MSVDLPFAEVLFANGGLSFESSVDASRFLLLFSDAFGCLSLADGSFKLELEDSGVCLGTRLRAINIV